MPPPNSPQVPEMALLVAEMSPMIIAVAAVYAAIAVTMFVNGSYAWSKGGSPADQYAILGLALAIDGCKCSFLRVSALCNQDGHRVAAILLFILWWPCLAYSTFAGYLVLAKPSGVMGRSVSSTWA